MLLTERANQPPSTSRPGIFYEEPVLFHHWLMRSRRIPFPANSNLWVETCSFGLHTVLTQFLTTAEFTGWQEFRTIAKEKLGERFVEDQEVREKGVERNLSDEVIRANRRHWQ